MFVKWMVRLIFIGALYCFNTAYRFFPEEWFHRYPYLRVLAIAVAIILLLLFIVEKVKDFQRISYAKVSASGNISEKKNFKYFVQKTTAEDGSVLYIIEEFYSEALLDIKTTKNLKYALSTLASGTGIQMFAKSSEGIKVESDFTIEMKR